jgi:hypothetical protein
MFLRFLCDRMPEECDELSFAGVAAERRAQVHFPVVAETRPDFAVGGQPDAVACFAEMLVRDRTNETD